jgi:hypothetical protein
MTWAARTETVGELVVKARRGGRAYDKTDWCAVHLPLLGARGYPVPAIVWHGLLGDDWHVVVQNRLPGRPLWPLTSLSWPVLEALLSLVELQADAGVPYGSHPLGVMQLRCGKATLGGEWGAAGGPESWRLQVPGAQGSQKGC